MVYMCDFSCNEIEKIGYCLKPIIKTTVKPILKQIDITEIIITEKEKLIEK